jgi:small subunit ribosomal protein S24e
MSGELQVEIIKSINNPLLSRKEYMIRLIHPKSATPSRDQVRAFLASKLGASIDRVIVKNLKTYYGTNVTLCKAHIYDSPEKIIEPEYIKLRNLPRTERKKALESMKASKTEVKQETKTK